MPERFECTTLAKKALYQYSSFPFLLLTYLLTYSQNCETGSDPYDLSLSLSAV